MIGGWYPRVEQGSPASAARTADGVDVEGDQEPGGERSGGGGDDTGDWEEHCALVRA